MRAGFARFVFGLLIAAAPSTAFAWDEGVDGDLSTNPLLPTPVTFLMGHNTIKGTVTTSAPADTRDYVTFTIPAGQQLIAIRQIRWVDLPAGTPGNTGFHALDDGATSLVPSGGNEAMFLGGDHMLPLASGSDLLVELSDGDTAGAGFPYPLGPGTYTYLVQQTGPQLSGYELEFHIATPSSTAVPLAAPWAIAMAALMLLGAGSMLVRRTGDRIIGSRSERI